MKIRGCAVVVVAGLLFSLQPVRAGNDDIQISCVAKKFGQQTNEFKVSEVSKEKWGYEVTLENKTFKDMANLEVKYITYFKQEKLGTTTGPKQNHKRGESKVDLLKAHDRAVFNTEAVEMKKTQLIDGGYYANGAKPKAQDSLVGLWIRIYQNGTQIAEFARPSNLTGKEKWE